jgi:two-component system response regulator FlrC
MFDDWLTTSAAALAPVTLPSAPVGVLTEINSASHMEQFMAAAKDNLGLQEQDSVEKPESLPTDLHSAARMNEHQVIMATLASTPSKSEAAKRLGISPRTLRYKMAQLREHGLAMAAAC